MKEKKGKSKLIIVMVLVVLIVGVVLFRDTKEKQINKDSQFIGIDDCFLGEFCNGKWYSANEYSSTYEYDFKISTLINVNKKDYTYQDIFDKKYFYLYNSENNTQIKKTDEIFYDVEKYPEYYNDINLFRFNTYNETDGKGSFCTSKELQNMQNNKILEITDYKEYRKYIEDILTGNNMGGEANIEKILQIDANSDGNDEIYIVANKRNDDVTKATDVYTLLVKIEKGEAQTVIQKILHKKLFENEVVSAVEGITGIDTINFVDFNNDGKLEMYVKTWIYDLPGIYVFTYNEANQLELCMQGYFGW